MKTINIKNEKKDKRHMLVSLKKNMGGWALISPSVFLLLMVSWIPIVIGITYSFFKLRGFTPVEFVGLANFKDVLSDTSFLRTLKNTILYVAFSLVIGLPLPFFLAVMINEVIHAQNFFKVTTYLPAVVPVIATSLIWQFVYADGSTGLLNIIAGHLGMGPFTWLSNKNLAIPLIIISTTWNGMGGTTLLYLAALQDVNQDAYEAARIDGAGVFSRFWHVLLPHMHGMILLLAVRQIIGVFQITEQPLTMTGGGPNGASLSLGLTNYYYAFKFGQFEKSLALGVVSFVILLGLTIVYFRLDKKFNE